MCIEWLVGDVYTSSHWLLCGEHILLSKSFNTLIVSLFFMFLLIRNKRSSFVMDAFMGWFHFYHRRCHHHRVRCMVAVFMGFDERVRGWMVSQFAMTLVILVNVEAVKAFLRHIRGQWLISCMRSVLQLSFFFYILNSFREFPWEFSIYRPLSRVNAYQFIDSRWEIICGVNGRYFLRSFFITSKSELKNVFSLE